MEENPSGVSLFCPACSLVIKQPRILPCLHSVCTSCIELNGHYTCPVCNELTNGIHSSQDIVKLPIDNLLDSVLDMVALHAGKNVPCDVCDESEQSKAVSRCKECAQYFCLVHYDAHKTAKFSKRHVMIEVDQLRECSLKDLRRPLYCYDHGEELLSTFCESRDRPVCKHCCLADRHHDHIHMSLDTAISKYHIEVNTLLKKATSLSKAIEKTMSDIDLVMANVYSKTKTLLGEIDLVFDYQINTLLKRKKELRLQVQDIRKSKTQTLKDQQDTLTYSLKKLQHACKFTDISMTTSANHNHASSLVLKNLLTSRLQYFLERESLFLDPMEDSFVELHFDDSSLHRAIETFGGLETRHVCPWQCIARGVGIKAAFVAELSKFLVLLMDQHGIRLSSFSELITVDIVTHTGSKVDVQYIINKGDATFEVAYKPKQQCTLEITVKVCRQHIKGSPFQVQVCNDLRKSWI